MEKKIAKILKESIAVKEKILKDQISIIAKMAELIIKSLKSGGKLIVFGNGGSACDSQHIAAELVGRFQKERRPLPAISLNTNVSTLTALANDYGYAVVFSRQIEALAKSGDIIMGISTSGKAENVNLAMQKAKSMGIKTLALSGKDGGKLAKLADLALIVPSNNTARIQEAHITIGHILCGLAEDALA